MSASANTGAVCRECALTAGFVPKNKVVGVWVDECKICHERKPCTDLVHDWTQGKTCGCGASVTGKTRRLAEKAWNRDPPEDAKEGAVE